MIGGVFCPATSVVKENTVVRKKETVIKLRKIPRVRRMVSNPFAQSSNGPMIRPSLSGLMVLLEEGCQAEVVVEIVGGCDHE
jgi:hypothetical protein